MELPDFHLPHVERIEWMIETDGYAVEPVPADPTRLIADIFRGVAEVPLDVKLVGVLYNDLR